MSEKISSRNPAKIKKEEYLYARYFGTASAIKKFTIKYTKCSFIKTTVNTWKKKCNDGDWTVMKRVGRANLLDSGMLKKVKDIALGTRMAGGVISRRQLISIATGVVRANNPNLLKEYSDDLVLTDKWARGVLEKLGWSKLKGTTGKVDPSPQFLAEEKFTFQRNILALVFEHDNPPSLIINIDQTPLSYVNTGKYTFSFKGAKNISIKGVDD